MLSLIIVIVTCVVNLSLGLLVLLRNPKQLLSIVFFFISLFVSLWAASNYLTSLETVPLLVNDLFNRMAFFAAFLAVASSLWFSYLFPRPVHVRRRMGRALSGLAAIVSVLSFTVLIAGEVTKKSHTLEFSIGPLLILYVVSIFLFLGLIINNLIQTFQKSRGNVRQQALFILMGFGLPIILGVSTNAIIPSLTDSWQSAGFGPAFTIMLVGMLTFTIIRHHLFDIRLAVARSFAYLLSIVVVALLYGVAAFSIYSFLLDGDINLGQEVFFAAFSALAALVFRPIKKVFDKLTNSIFYQDAYDSQAFIDQLNRALVSYTDLDTLLVNSATIIRNNLKAEFCLFGVPDPKNPEKPLIVGSDKKDIAKQDILLGQHTLPHMDNPAIVTDNLEGEHIKLKAALDRAGVAIIVRLSSTSKRDDVVGYLIIGNKKSGNPYSTQDAKLVSILANGLVIAIQNAYRFQEIQNFNITLQERVEEATHKLRRTNDKLRKLDETKDDFISMASHQLRTPLTSVKGYVSMVLDGDAGQITPLQRKLLTQSFISSQRMVYLISDLLNVSRLRTGKFVIEAAPTNLARMIEEEIDQLQETAKGRNLSLAFHKPDHFPALMLDETKMRQVIMNFIDNAVYYTPGGGHITVNLVDRPKTIEFTVADDGIGVPRHEQHHLFTKFFRAHNAKRARPDGTGLGLFMAKKVIIAQGGAVVFKSQEGKGSTFGFTFAKDKLLPPGAAPYTETAAVPVPPKK